MGASSSGSRGSSPPLGEAYGIIPHGRRRPQKGRGPQAERLPQIAFGREPPKQDAADPAEREAYATLLAIAMGHRNLVAPFTGPGDEMARAPLVVPPASGSQGSSVTRAGRDLPVNRRESMLLLPGELESSRQGHSQATKARTALVGKSLPPIALEAAELQGARRPKAASSAKPSDGNSSRLVLPSIAACAAEVQGFPVMDAKNADPARSRHKHLRLPLPAVPQALEDLD